MKTHKKLTTPLLSAVIAIASVSINVAAQASEIPEAVLEHFQFASQGNKDATKSAYESLLALNENKPGSPLINTVLGSTETMMGRDAWMPWNKMKYVERGLARMDKAIQLLSPEDLAHTFQGLPLPIWVQTTVGCTFVEMPQMFNRLNAGYDLLQDTMNHELMEHLPFEAKSAAYLCSGIAAEKAGKKEEAMKYLNTIITNVPDSAEATQAQEIIQKLM